MTFCALVSAGLAACAARQSHPIAVTPDGRLRGAAANGRVAWLGIPYAAPPVGVLRWRPPAPVKPWPGVRDAVKAGAACPQPGGEGRGSSEDCLFLDVYRPADSSRNLPVLVYIHGGSFVVGSGDDFDPTRLVTGAHMIVVTLNYRLGALGFLTLPGLDGAGPTGGDFGLEDQQAALRWVQRSIGAFGGDPRRVTIDGQSAGGISVCDLLVSPAARGLFSAAIDQSGPCTGPDAALPTAAGAAAAGGRFAAALGCPVPATAPACLRRAPVSSLVNGPAVVGGGPVPLPWRPVVDGTILPAQPEALLAASKAAAVPVLNGSNLDDGALFVPGIATPARYHSWLQGLFGSFATAVAQHYPVAPHADGAAVRAMAGAVVTDAGFACPAATADHLLAARPSGRVWGYEFADTRAGPLGAYHSAELGYLFTSVAGRAPLPASTAALSAAMVRAWGSVATAGTPGIGWPAATTIDTPVERLAAGGPRPDTTFESAHNCTFWATSGR